MVVLNREWVLWSHVYSCWDWNMVGSFRMELQSLAHRICHMEDLTSAVCAKYLIASENSVDPLAKGWVL